MISLGHERSGPRLRATWTVLRQCAWCGAVRIGDRFLFHHRLPLLTWVVYPQLSTWVSLVIGLSHGVCPRCVDDLMSGQPDPSRDQSLAN